MGFFKSLIKELTDAGHTVDIAANEQDSPVPDCYREWGCKVFPISTSRSPFSIGNLKAIKQIRALAKDYDIVHCHTPLAAAATRIACRPLRKKQGLRVIYTAHGFHFYKGAPKKNWIIYYPVEKYCSRFTDVLITINKEDYELATRKFRARRVEYVPGVGIDVEKFADTHADRAAKRRELGIPDDAKLILSVGELNENKNHRLVIEALAKLGRADVCYLIAGVGDRKSELEQLAKERSVTLLLPGYRRDVAELYKAADLFVFPSFREGLPVSLMEAMAAGLPCLASAIRGSADLLPPAFLFSPNDSDGLAKLMCESLASPERKQYDLSEYDVKKINERMNAIYSLI